MTLSIKKHLIPLGAALAVVTIALVLQWKLSKPAGAPHPPPAARSGAPVDLTLFAGPIGSPESHDLKALESELKKKPNHGPILLKMAEVARNSGKPAEALGYLKQLAAAEPKNAEGRLELGRALFESGDIDGAIAETKAAVEITPEDADALYNLGAIYGNLSQDAEARKYFTRAMEVAPDSPSGKRAKESLTKLAAN